MEKARTLLNIDLLIHIPMNNWFDELFDFPAAQTRSRGLFVNSHSVLRFRNEVATFSMDHSLIKKFNVFDKFFAFIALPMRPVSPTTTRGILFLIFDCEEGFT